MKLVRQVMTADLERTGSFVTLFHARLDVASRRLSYVDAGHGHVFVLRENGAVEEMRQGGPPLGVPTEEEYQEGAVALHPGDSLVIYSDGLAEVRPKAPLDRRAVARQVGREKTASAMVERLIALAALTGPPPDDLTVLVLRCSSNH